MKEDFCPSWVIINEPEVWHLTLSTGESAVDGFTTSLCLKKKKEKRKRRAAFTSCLLAVSVRKCFHPDVGAFHASCRCNARLRHAPLQPSITFWWLVCLSVETGRWRSSSRSYRGRPPDGGATCLTLQPSFFEWSPPRWWLWWPASRLVASFCHLIPFRLCWRSHQSSFVLSGTG